MGELRLQTHCPIHFEAESLSFGLYSKDEIMKLSVVECFNPSSFNQLGHPTENGLHDLKMGPSVRYQPCGTCLQTDQFCPGHIGHIRLPIPVINPMYYSAIKQLLKMSCFSCKTIKLKDIQKDMYIAQIQFLSLGLATQAETVSDIAKGMGNDKKDLEKTVKSSCSILKESSTIVDNLKDYVEEEMDKHKNKILKEDVKESDYNRMIYNLMKGYTKDIFKACGKKCGKCGAEIGKLIKTRTGFIYEGIDNTEDIDDEEVIHASRGGKVRGKCKKKTVKFELNASELMEMFRKLYVAEKEILDVMYPVLKANENMEHPMDIFFVEVLAVSPPKSRPCQKMMGSLTIHPQTTTLTEVLNTVVLMRPILQVINGTPLESLSPESQVMINSLSGDTNILKLAFVWKQLQGKVDNVLDANMNTKKPVPGAWGLKQVIERKEGVFRMNMMGKRVNHAARTVITPDPNIKIDEIGIPEVFAKKLTYPVPVTPFNVRELREYILNGPNKHPGANMLENEFGKITYLDQRDYNQRVMIANTLLVPTYRNKKSQRPKIVHRHLKNGDATLLNRQPSLHKPSIMAHKARVLKGEKVLRLHYSNCKSYNADFDGDEMNCHFPQSERSRAEAYNICLSSTQYLGPKDGAPLQGLIQDHVIAGVKMTLRGRFFTRTEYLQLVYQALQRTIGRIKTLPPAILKPQVLWSGKQVLSTILINITPLGMPPPNYTGQAKIRSKLWQNSAVRSWKAGGRPERNDVLMSESDIVIRGGILCSGILDKSQYGATAYSLTHLLFELYGDRPPCDFLSGISVLFTYFLQSMEGFSLGVQDILVKDEANNRRTEVMQNTLYIGDQCAAKGVGAKEEVGGVELCAMMEESHRTSRTNPRARMELDAGYKEFLNPATNDINAICVPAGLIKPFPDNNLQLMVNSGAKGSTVNTTQISCLLGQIELEGKRPPVMISGKSLPSFPAYCTLPRAGGYIDGRFMTGIQPQEFFFHCMAGREGLIDTAVKTSRSGYLQRCLIKLLEGLMVHHDFTVRDSDNTVVQFQYGEDSMDICKSQYIKPSKLSHLSCNLDAVHHQQTVEAAKSSADLKAVKVARKELKKWSKRSKDGSNLRNSPFLKLTSIREDDGYDRVDIVQEGVTIASNSRPKQYRKALKEYIKMSNEDKKALKDDAVRRPDPIASRYLPPVNFSSVTEVCDEMINNYASNNYKNKLDADKFKEAMYLKVQQASVSPGEPVGVLAAQSVGEPSTQMTLNTFHFAGRGEMNVTLGIPRLREILMVASNNIKTPSMTVPFLPTVGEKERDKLRLRFNRVTVEDILEEVQVKEKLVLSPKRARKVTIRYKFLPHKYYKKDFGIKQSQVLAYMENRFFNKVFLPNLDSLSKEKVRAIIEKDDNDKRSTDLKSSTETSAELMADKLMGDNDDSDNEGENIEDEGTDMSRKAERQGDREYEKLEDEDEKVKKVAGEDIGEDQDVDDPEEKEQVVDQEDEALGGMDYQDEEQQTAEDAEALLNDQIMESGFSKRRRRNFLDFIDNSKSPAQIIDYKFDADKEQWCEVTLEFDVRQKQPDLVNVIRKSASRGVILQVRNIKKAFVIEKDGGKFALQTDGINIEQVHRFDRLLDLNRLHVNSIHDMAASYGIEAASKTIVQEVKNVFGVYGIDVDVRHLNLIADYMTIDGTYKPFNRYGIAGNPSPLQQITFETAIPFLRAAILEGKHDSLTSPSAQIVTGKHVGVGTGSVHLLYKNTA